MDLGPPNESLLQMDRPPRRNEPLNNHDNRTNSERPLNLDNSQSDRVDRRDQHNTRDMSMFGGSAHSGSRMINYGRSNSQKDNERSEHRPALIQTQNNNYRDNRDNNNEMKPYGRPQASASLVDPQNDTHGNSQNETNQSHINPWNRKMDYGKAAGVSQNQGHQAVENRHQHLKSGGSSSSSSNGQNQGQHQGQHQGHHNGYSTQKSYGESSNNSYSYQSRGRAAGHGSTRHTSFSSDNSGGARDRESGREMNNKYGSSSNHHGSSSYNSHHGHNSHHNNHHGHGGGYNNHRGSRYHHGSRYGRGGYNPYSGRGRYHGGGKFNNPEDHAAYQNSTKEIKLTAEQQKFYNEINMKIEDILTYPGNNKCCDCQAFISRESAFCIIHYGILVCESCKSYHEQLKSKFLNEGLGPDQVVKDWNVHHFYPNNTGFTSTNNIYSYYNNEHQPAQLNSHEESFKILPANVTTYNYKHWKMCFIHLLEFRKGNEWMNDYYENSLHEGLESAKNYFHPYYYSMYKLRESDALHFQHYTLEIKYLSGLRSPTENSFLKNVSTLKDELGSIDIAIRQAYVTKVCGELVDKETILNNLGSPGYRFSTAKIGLKFKYISFDEKTGQKTLTNCTFDLNGQIIEIKSIDNGPETNQANQVQPIKSINLVNLESILLNNKRVPNREDMLQLIYSDENNTQNVMNLFLIYQFASKDQNRENGHSSHEGQPGQPGPGPNPPLTRTRSVEAKNMIYYWVNIILRCKFKLLQANYPNQSPRELSNLLNSYIIKQCYCTMPRALTDNDSDQKQTTDRLNPGLNPQTSQRRDSNDENANLTMNSNNDQESPKNKILTVTTKSQKISDISQIFNIDENNVKKFLYNDLSTEVKQKIADRIKVNASGMIYMTLSETRLCIFDKIEDKYSVHSAEERNQLMNIQNANSNSKNEVTSVDNRLKDTALIQLELTLAKPTNQNGGLIIETVTNENSLALGNQNSPVHDPNNPSISSLAVETGGNHGQQIMNGNATTEITVQSPDFLTRTAVQYFNIISEILRLDMTSVTGYDTWVRNLADTLGGARYDVSKISVNLLPQSKCPQPVLLPILQSPDQTIKQNSLSQNQHSTNLLNNQKSSSPVYSDGSRNYNNSLREQNGLLGNGDHAMCTNNSSIDSNMHNLSNNMNGNTNNNTVSESSMSGPFLSMSISDNQRNQNQNENIQNVQNRPFEETGNQNNYETHQNNENNINNFNSNNESETNSLKSPPSYIRSNNSSSHKLTQLISNDNVNVNQNVNQNAPNQINAMIKSSRMNPNEHLSAQSEMNQIHSQNVTNQNQSQSQSLSQNNLVQNADIAAEKKIINNCPKSYKLALDSHGSSNQNNNNSNINNNTTTINSYISAVSNTNTSDHKNNNTNQFSEQNKNDIMKPLPTVTNNNNNTITSNIVQEARATENRNQNSSLPTANCTNNFLPYNSIPNQSSSGSSNQTNNTNQNLLSSTQTTAVHNNNNVQNLSSSISDQSNSNPRTASPPNNNSQTLDPNTRQITINNQTSKTENNLNNRTTENQDAQNQNHDQNNTKTNQTTKKDDEKDEKDEICYPAIGPMGDIGKEARGELRQNEKENEGSQGYYDKYNRGEHRKDFRDRENFRDPRERPDFRDNRDHRDRERDGRDRDYEGARPPYEKRDRDFRGPLRETTHNSWHDRNAHRERLDHRERVERPDRERPDREISDRFRTSDREPHSSASYRDRDNSNFRDRRDERERERRETQNDRPSYRETYKNDYDRQAHEKEPNLRDYPTSNLRDREGGPGLYREQRDREAPNNYRERLDYNREREHPREQDQKPRPNQGGILPEPTFNSIHQSADNGLNSRTSNLNNKQQINSYGNEHMRKDERRDSSGNTNNTNSRFTLSNSDQTDQRDQRENNYQNNNQNNNPNQRPFNNNTRISNPNRDSNNTSSHTNGHDLQNSYSSRNSPNMSSYTSHGRDPLLDSRDNLAIQNHVSNNNTTANNKLPYSNPNHRNDNNSQNQGQNQDERRQNQNKNNNFYDYNDRSINNSNIENKRTSPNNNAASQNNNTYDNHNQSGQSGPNHFNYNGQDHRISPNSSLMNENKYMSNGQNIKNSIGFGGVISVLLCALIFKSNFLPTYRTPVPMHQSQNEPKPALLSQNGPNSPDLLPNSHFNLNNNLRTIDMDNGTQGQRDRSDRTNNINMNTNINNCNKNDNNSNKLDSTIMPHSSNLQTSAQKNDNMNNAPDIDGGCFPPILPHTHTTFSRENNTEGIQQVRDPIAGRGHLPNATTNTLNTANNTNNLNASKNYPPTSGQSNVTVNGFNNNQTSNANANTNNNHRINSNSNTSNMHAYNRNENNRPSSGSHENNNNNSNSSRPNSSGYDLINEVPLKNNNMSSRNGNNTQKQQISVSQNREQVYNESRENSNGHVPQNAAQNGAGAQPNGFRRLSGGPDNINGAVNTQITPNNAYERDLDKTYPTPPNNATTLDEYNATGLEEKLTLIKDSLDQAFTILKNDSDYDESKNNLNEAQKQSISVKSLETTIDIMNKMAVIIYSKPEDIRSIVGVVQRYRALRKYFSENCQNPYILQYYQGDEKNILFNAVKGELQCQIDDSYMRSREMLNQKEESLRQQVTNSAQVNNANNNRQNTQKFNSGPGIQSPAVQAPQNIGLPGSNYNNQPFTNNEKFTNVQQPNNTNAANSNLGPDQEIDSINGHINNLSASSNNNSYMDNASLIMNERLKGSNSNHVSNGGSETNRSFNEAKSPVANNFNNGGGNSLLGNNQNSVQTSSNSNSNQNTIQATINSTSMNSSFHSTHAGANGTNGVSIDRGPGLIQDRPSSTLTTLSGQNGTVTAQNANQNALAANSSQRFTPNNKVTPNITLNNTFVNNNQKFDPHSRNIHPKDLNNRTNGKGGYGQSGYVNSRNSPNYGQVNGHGYGSAGYGGHPNTGYVPAGASNGALNGTGQGQGPQGGTPHNNNGFPSSNTTSSNNSTNGGSAYNNTHPSQINSVISSTGASPNYPTSENSYQNGRNINKYCSGHSGPDPMRNLSGRPANISPIKSVHSHYGGQSGQNQTNGYGEEVENLSFRDRIGHASGGPGSNYSASGNFSNGYGRDPYGVGSQSNYHQSQGGHQNQGSIEPETNRHDMNGVNGGYGNAGNPNSHLQNESSYGHNSHMSNSYNNNNSTINNNNMYNNSYNSYNNKRHPSNNFNQHSQSNYQTKPQYNGNSKTTSPNLQDLSEQLHITARTEFGQPGGQSINANKQGGAASASTNLFNTTPSGNSLFSDQKDPIKDIWGSKNEDTAAVAELWN